MVGLAGDFNEVVTEAIGVIKKVARRNRRVVKPMSTMVNA